MSKSVTFDSPVSVFLCEMIPCRSPSMGVRRKRVTSDDGQVNFYKDDYNYDEKVFNIYKLILFNLQLDL